MITINLCMHCGAQFLIPDEWSDGLDTTLFLCPECSSENWTKLVDSPIQTGDIVKTSLID